MAKNFFCSKLFWGFFSELRLIFPVCHFASRYILTIVYFWGHLHFSTEQSDILNFFRKFLKSFQNEFLESRRFELRSVLQHLGPPGSQVPEAVTPGWCPQAWCCQHQVHEMGSRKACRQKGVNLNNNDWMILLLVDWQRKLSRILTI